METSSNKNQSLPLETRVLSRDPSALTIQPLWQFILLSIASGGLYHFLWVWRFWKVLKTDLQAPVQPFWRSILHWLFTPQLFRQIHVLALQGGYNGGFSPALFGITYYVLFMLRFLGLPFSLLSLLSFVPFIPVVRCWQEFQIRKFEGARFTNTFRLADLSFVVVFWAMEFLTAFVLRNYSL